MAYSISTPRAKADVDIWRDRVSASPGEYASSVIPHDFRGLDMFHNSFHNGFTPII